MLNYTEIQPTAELQPYIRHFGVLEDDGRSSGETTTFRILADGCPGLISQENADCFSDQKNHKLPQLFVHGLTTSNSQKTTRGKYCNIGVYFQPNGLKSIFGIDASELTDRYADLNDLVKNHLTEQLLSERNAGMRISILSDFLFHQIVKNKYRENQKASYALGRINTDSHDNLFAIQAALALSERSLERIFKADVGISPKLYFRICRFQAALDCMRNQAFSSFAELAHRHAYADQSHFIREFRQFTGATPKQFLLQAHEQSLNFPEWRS